MQYVLIEPSNESEVSLMGKKKKGKNRKHHAEMLKALAELLIGIGTLITAVSHALKR